jgi:hypothetical protein
MEGASEFGYFQLSSERITVVKTVKEKNGFGGSKSFKTRLVDGKVVIEKKPIKEKQIKSKQSDNIDNAGCVNKGVSGENEKKERRKVYQVKKKEVRGKANAIFYTRAAKKCLNFVTISFPMNMNDDSIFKVFNVWLTRLRKVYRLDLYLWVSERQKNGTLHYHILIPQWLPIRMVNAYMAIAIDNELRKCPQDGVNYEKLKYNGVDLKRCEGNLKKLSYYLTKYVSKNNETFNRLAWHCSRSVSNLFTNYNTPYWGEIESLLNGRVKISRSYEMEYADILFIENECTMKVLKLLARVNDDMLGWSPVEQPKQPIIVESANFISTGYLF